MSHFCKFILNKSCSKQNPKVTKRTIKRPYSLSLRTQKFILIRDFYLHVVHDELEEPSQGAAFLLYSRIHFSTGSEKSSTSQHANFF